MQTIYVDDIKKDLLSKFYRDKFVFIFLIVLDIFMVVSDVLIIAFPHIINPNLSLFGRLFAIFGATTLAILFTVLLFKYFRNIYYIKKNRFTVDTERLYSKGVEYINYYRYNTKKENVLYFKSGKIFVDELTYKSARIDDEFYLILLNNKQLSYVYNKKHYSLNIHK